MTADSNDIIREHVEKIAGSGLLGRSRFYVALLRFLAECSSEDHVPKEHEIATRVFKRAPDFDPTQDALVRVYAHNLRQKLREYYAGAGRDEVHRISLSKGEYRLMVIAREDAGDPVSKDEETPSEANEPRPSRPRARPLVAGASLLALGGVLGGGAVSLLPSLEGSLHDVDSPQTTAAEKPLWRGLLGDDLPILVVAGDYYIFGEIDDDGNVSRMIRNFSINSPGDLDEYIMQRPERAKRYIDLDLTYLPVSTATALHDVLQVLDTSHKPIRVRPMSELSAEDMRSNHIVYVGYISGLDKLLGFAFSSSGLSIGETYDQLVDLSSGKVYASDAGLPTRDRNYRDYGLLQTFAGPGGNRFVIVAGTRDAGLMEAAHAATTPDHLEAIDAALPGQAHAVDPSFEVLYEVDGFDRTNLSDVILHAQPLAPRHNWGAAMLPPD